MVEKAYEQYLFDECSKQTNYKSGLEKQARKEKDPENQKLQARRAAEFELTRCVELDDLFPGRRSGRNKNQRYRAYWSIQVNKSNNKANQPTKDV